MNLGIPYMGSKRKLAKPILDHILREHPNTTHFFDLFGGGGAMSFEALQRGLSVVYNEKNPAIVALLRDIRENGVRPEYYEWISREHFHELKNGDDWKAGITQTCWSFGNNVKKGYLFSAENEELKRPLHEIVVNRCEKSRLEFAKKYGLEIPSHLLNGETVNERRLAVMSFVKKNKGRTDLEQLERLERLELLQQLLQLERLQQLQQLHITCGSFDEVVINTPIESTVIYCDPPYVNTAEYNDCGFDIQSLYKWIEKCKYPVYLSSYESHLTCVAEFAHRSTLSSSNNSKQTVERLFSNVKSRFVQKDLFA